MMKQKSCSCGQPRMKQSDFKKRLAQRTGCTIQHNGWCCGTCFYTISEKLNNDDWRALLHFRGDYTKEEADIGDNWMDSIEKIWGLIK